MIFKDISILNEDMEVQPDKWVVTKGTHISYVGDEPKGAEAEALTFNQEVYCEHGKLLLPGFFNAHAHSPMTLMRGYGENFCLKDWLEKKIFPFESELCGKDVYWATMLAIAESIRYGIVSTSDMYYFCQDMARAVLETGVKNNLSRGITNFSGADLWSMDAAQEMRSLYEEYQEAGEGKLKIDMSLHGEYTSDVKTAEGLAEYASKVGARIQVHVSETKAEHEACKERNGGNTPVEYLAKRGIFDNPTTAAHCVYIEGNDYNILKRKGVTVAVNPVSNMKLASGVCNVPELLKRGIKIAIGTDGVASNNSLNFIEEMKVLGLGCKVMYCDFDRLTPEAIVEAATLGGAQAQGREDCGVIKSGYRADLIVVDISYPSMHPVHNLLNNLIYSGDGGSVAMTMVDGRVLYRDGEYETIDLERVFYETESGKERILRNLNKGDEAKI